MDSSKQPVKFTIYCHTHIESDRRYIGLTKKTMLQRWNQHVHNANRKSGKGCRHFWNAIRKYGKDAFFHEILKVCASLEEANAYEEYFIDLFRTRDPQFGFNLMNGGRHMPHPVKNPWDRPGFREKALECLAKANDIPREVRVQRTKELWNRPEFREKVSSVLRDNMANLVIRDRSVQDMKAAFATPESRSKRSASSKRLWESDEFRARNAELWQDEGFRARCESGLRHGASLNVSKTHCPLGHEYSPENTVVNSKGSRECLVCKRGWSREWARRHRARVRSEDRK